MEGSAQQGEVVNGTQVGGCRQPCKDSTGVRINYLGGLLTPSMICLRATTLKRILSVEICMYVKNFNLVIVKLVLDCYGAGMQLLSCLVPHLQSQNFPQCHCDQPRDSTRQTRQQILLCLSPALWCCSSSGHHLDLHRRSSSCFPASVKVSSNAQPRALTLGRGGSRGKETRSTLTRGVWRPQREPSPSPC